MADPKPVYRAVSKDAAETALDELKRNGVSSIRWCSSRGDANVENLSAYPPSGEYPQSHYTTNAIEVLRTVSSEADEN